MHAVIANGAANEVADGHGFGCDNFAQAGSISNHAILPVAAVEMIQTGRWVQPQFRGSSSKVVQFPLNRAAAAVWAPGRRKCLVRRGTGLPALSLFAAGTSF